MSPTKGRRSPLGSTLKSSDKLNGLSTMKSTSTVSDLINGKKNTIKNLRSDFGMFDTKEIGELFNN
jgi:hypothetical protein